MPTQRKPTPRKAAYKATELPTSKVETDRRIPLIVLAVIAAIMALVLIFTQCSAPQTPTSSVPGIGEPAPTQVVSSSSEPVDEVEAPENPSAKATLNDYTWEELSQISDKISAAASDTDAIYIARQYGFVNASGTLDSSATKTIELSDGSTAAVRIIGFNHDVASDGSGRAGITFMFADSVGSMAYNEDGTNYGGWASSSISYALYNNIYSQMPTDLVDNIVEVDKAYNTGEADSIAESNDVIWLPSYIEVAGSIGSDLTEEASTLQQEGSQYKLFADAGVSASGNNSILVMHDSSGQASAWWLRSADVAAEDSFCYVNAAGSPSGAAPADQDYLLVPCFSL